MVAIRDDPASRGSDPPARDAIVSFASSPDELRFLDLLARQAADLLERRAAEGALRESEGRQAFLLKLSDAIRPPPDLVAVHTTAMRLLAEQLNVMRASYFELEEDGDTFHLAGRFERDAAPMPERMRLSDFSPALFDAYRRRT